MAGLFPDGGAGGLIVRDPATGLPIAQPDVEGVQVPPLPFGTTCDFTALPENCSAKIEKRQINAIVSEMVMLASIFDPDGTWDCTQYDNLAKMFLAWAADFSGQDIGGQICSVAESDGKEVAASLLYCANAIAYKLPIVGPDSLVQLVQETICAEAPIGDANTNADYLLYCRNGVFRKTSAIGFDNFTGEWYDGRAYATRHMVRKEGRLWSPNAAIPVNTAFVIGTTGQTWYEVSPSATPPWNQQTGYLKGDVINRDGKFYAANNDIPPNTAFVIGTTGATWREIDITEAFILPFDAAKNYKQYTVFTNNGSLYRATAGPVPAAPFNPASFELLGGENNLYRGPWVQAPAYATNHMVQLNGKLYSPNAAIPANTPFAEGTTGATWREVSPSVAPAFDPADAYSQDAMIAYNGKFYAANDDIPAGTPFVEGTTGATWREVSMNGTSLVLRDFSSTKNYVKDELVAYPPGVVPVNVYRAKASGHAAGPWNAGNFDIVIGTGSGANTWKGQWAPNTTYTLGDYVIHTPTGFSKPAIWMATVGMPIGTPTFDLAQWQVVVESGLILPYALARRYASGDFILLSGQLYMANNVINSGTAFVIGYSGATWRPMDQVRMGGSYATTTKTLGPGDENAFQVFSAVGLTTVTVPTNVTWNCPIGTVFSGRCSIGTVTFVGVGGVTILGPDNKVTTRAVVNAPFSLIKEGADTWSVAGDLA